MIYGKKQRAGGNAGTWRSSRTTTWKIAHESQRRTDGPAKVWGAKQDNLQPGMVVSFPFHKPDYDISPPASFDVNRTLINSEFLVHAKLRKIIVFKRYSRHCITVPIFSHGGNGLRSHARDQDVYVGVRDVQSLNPSPSESKHQNFLVRRDEKWENDERSNAFHIIVDRSHAQWSRPVCIDYDIPCEIQGRIEDENEVERLIKLFYQDTPSDLGQTTEANDGNGGGRWQPATKRKR